MKSHVAKPFNTKGWKKWNQIITKKKEKQMYIVKNKKTNVH